MNFFKKLKLRHRLLLITIPTTVILYSVAAFIIHTTQVNSILDNSKPLMEQHLSNLADLINTYKGQSTMQEDYARKLINNLEAKLKVNDEDTVARSLKRRLIKQAKTFEVKQKKRTDRNNLSQLKENFYSKRYYKSGFPFAIDAKGYFIIHPSRENENVLSENFFRRMQEMRKGILEMNDEKLMKETFVFYSFDIESEMYVCITVPKDEFIDDQIQSIDFAMFILGSLAVLSFGFFIYFLANEITSPLRTIRGSLGDIIKGEFSRKDIQYPYKDIIRQIFDSLSIHLRYLRSAALFAENIREGKYDLDFEPLGSADDLGNALIAMRDNLMQAETERESRRVEDEVRQWEAKGIAKFNDLLRQSGQNFESFSYAIIRGIADYVSAHLGAIFIYDQKDFSSGIQAEELSLVASHAYEQKKFIDKRFRTGEGLVGVCAAERKSIFLTEVPENYLKVRSGLGDSKPQSLLFVPILLEDKPFGVIELASIHVLEAHKIEFVEKISTTIATTLANAKNSIRTQELLNDSQRHAEQMKLQEELMRAQLDEMELEKEMADGELTHLRKKESMSSLVFEKSIEAIMLTNEEGLITNANQAALQLFGIELGGDVDFSIQELVIIRDLKLFFSRIGQWQRVKAIHTEGKITPIEVYMNLVSSRGEKVMLVYIKNISRLAALESDLQRQMEDNDVLRKRIVSQRKNIDKLQNED